MKPAPELPQTISNDGREIWDWAGKLSDHVQRQDRIRKLNARIIKIGTVCGDCSKWMKSRECPQEKNVRGRNVGPSCETIKCNAFIEARSATRLRDQLATELAKEVNHDRPDQ